MMQNLISPLKIAECKPQGHINASNADHLKTQLTALVNSDIKGVLVDLHQVEGLDSAGLMALVAALSLAQRQDKRFSLCCVPPAIKMILELTQLDRVFEIFENRREFEAACSKD